MWKKRSILLITLIAVAGWANLIGLNSVTLQFEEYDISTGGVLVLDGSASTELRYLTKYTDNFYVGLDTVGNIYEYTLDGNYVTEYVTTQALSKMLNPSKINNELATHYDGIDILEGMKTFNGYTDGVWIDGVTYGVKDTGLYAGHTKISDWGSTITGISQIPEPATITLIGRASLCLIILGRLS